MEKFVRQHAERLRLRHACIITAKCFRPTDLTKKWDLKGYFSRARAFQDADALHRTGLRAIFRHLHEWPGGFCAARGPAVEIRLEKGNAEHNHRPTRQSH